MIAKGSPKTVAASRKEVPCFFKFNSALPESHSNSIRLFPLKIRLWRCFYLTLATDMQKCQGQAAEMKTTLDPLLEIGHEKRWETWIENHAAGCKNPGELGSGHGECLTIKDLC